MFASPDCEAELDSISWDTFLASVLTALGLSSAAGYWLVKTLVGHFSASALESQKLRLAKELERAKSDMLADLEQKKASLATQLAEQKAMIEGTVRRSVEQDLGESAARRQYEYEARKRLYLAIGPLRFQLLLACRELAERVRTHGGWDPYPMKVVGYYGESMLYRILRPLAIVELVEREIAFSDFSVDPSALDLLKLKSSLRRIWSGDELVVGHPAVDWNQQSEHLFAGSIDTLAAKLIRPTERGAYRVCSFPEFSMQIRNDGVDSLDPLARLLNGFDITKKPILWVRLLAYANACNEWIGRNGTDLGFAHRDFAIGHLLAACRDAHILEHQETYIQRIRALHLAPL